MHSLALLTVAVLSLQPVQTESLTPLPVDLAPYQEVILKDEIQIGTIQVTRQTSAWNLPRGSTRYSREMQLRLTRFGNPVALRLVETEDRMPKGEIQSLGMRQYQGSRQLFNLQGTMTGDRMRVIIEGNREAVVPFNLQTYGPLGREFALAQRNWKIGDVCSFQAYLPVVNRVTPIQVMAKKAEGVLNSVLAVEMTPGKIVAGEQSLQLPTVTFFLDENQNILVTKTELEGIGEVLLVRNFRNGNSKSPLESFDIGKAALIPLNRKIPAAKSSLKVAYKIIPLNRGAQAPEVPQDFRQTIQTNAKGELTLEVRAFRTPGDIPASPPPRAEEMAPSKFLDWDQPSVRLLANNLAKREMDPWRKAVLLESLVRQRMTFDNQAQLASASEIAFRPRGDCRHAALLLSALLRVEEIPSRVVHGLIYVEKNGLPFMGFHMWTEAYVRGVWIPLDGTVGLGFVAADHVKISHHTYAGVESLAPMAAVQPFIGKIKMEVE